MKFLLSFRFVFLAGGSILILIPSLSPEAQAQTVNWKTPVDGAWSDPSKWNTTPAAVPLPTAGANFAGGNYTVTVDGNTINNLGIAGTQISFNLAGNLTVSDTLGLIAGASGRILGTGTLNSGKIALNGGTFTISQANVITGDFMSNNGGTLLIQNQGSLTSGANTITTLGFKATVDGTGSKWTNTGLLRAAALTITSGGTVTTDNARIDGTLTMTAGTFRTGELLFNIGGGSVKQGSSITSTSAVITAPVTLDASTWDNSAGRFTKQNNLMKMTAGAQLSSKSAELSASGGMSVEGAGSVWNNTEDVTVTGSSLFTGLLAGGGGRVNVGRDLLVATSGFTGLNYSDNSVASRMDVTGKVDVTGGSVYAGRNATLTSKGAVTRVDNAAGRALGSSLTVDGTWTNTGDFVVGESGQNGINNANGLEVRGTVTTTADLIVGKLAAFNDFTLWDGSAVTDVNGVLAQGAGVVTNAFIGNFGATSARWTNTGTLTIADAGTASLRIDAGGKVSSAAATVGKLAGAKGDVDLRGGGNLTVNGDFIIGAAGKGTVAVDTGSTLKVTGATLTLGRDTGSTGSLTLASSGQSSVFDFTGDLRVGLAGSGTLNIARGFQLDRAAKALVLGGLANASGTLDVMDDGSRYKSGDLTIGALGTGILKIENKGFVQTTGTATLGEMAGGDGMATLTGTGSKWQVDGSLIVGKGGSSNNNAKGTVTVSDNATLTVNGAQLVLGQETGSRGRLVVDGINAKVEGTGATNLEIGRHGTGTLQLQNHAYLSLASTILGVQNDGAGRIIVVGTSGGQATELHVGGSLTVGGASAGVAANAFEPGSKGGELVISGGGRVNALGTLSIARDAGSTGTVNLSGKGSELAGVIDALVGEGGTGTLTVSSGAAFTASALTLGQNPGSDGTVRITGSGGTDDASLHVSHLTVGKEGTGRLFLENGAKLDDAFLDVKVGYRTNASGQLTVDGTGSLLNIGQLDLGGAGGDGQLKILNGGKVTVNANVYVGPGEGLAGAGSILVGGAASTLSAPYLFLERASAGLPALSVTAGGSVVVTGTGDVVLEVGSGSGGIPAVLINGAGAHLTVENGKSSVTGTMTINGGGTATFKRLDIIPPSGEALVSVGGDSATTSTLTVSERLVVGVQGRSGTLDIGAGGELDSGLLLDVISGDIKVHGQGARLNSPFFDLTFGTLNVSDGGAVSTGNGLSALAGKISLFGNGARLSAGSISLGGGSTFAATGGTEATIETSLTIGQGNSLSNGGSINIGTSPLQAPDGTINVGTFGHLVDNGEIFGQVVVLPGGKLSGSGTINGNVINGGKAGPGDPQTLTVNGNYQQSAGAVLQIAIAGKTSDAMDHFNVTGQTTLAPGAKLELNFIDWFAPKMGDVFRFLQTAGGMIGNFATVVIRGLAPGFQYTVGSDAAGNFGLTALNDGVFVPPPNYDLVELPPVDSATSKTARVTLQLPASPPAAMIYRVRASSDLFNWKTIATRTGSGPWSGPAAVTTGPAAGGFVRITVAETLPLDSSGRFHRLETEDTSP